MGYDELFMHSLECFFGIYFPVEEIHRNTVESA